MATYRHNLGLVLRDLGDLQGARAEYERALEISEATLGRNHPNVAAYRNNLGSIVGAVKEDAPGEDLGPGF